MRFYRGTISSLIFCMDMERRLRFTHKNAFRFLVLFLFSRQHFNVFTEYDTVQCFNIWSAFYILLLIINKCELCNINVNCYGGLMIKSIHSSHHQQPWFMNEWMKKKKSGSKKTFEINFILLLFILKRKIILSLSRQMKIDFESVKCSVFTFSRDH